MAKLFDQQQLSAGVQEFEEHLRRVRERDWTVDSQVAKPRNDLRAPGLREGVRKAAARNARGAAPGKGEMQPAGLPIETIQSRRLILALAALVLVTFAGAMSLALTDGGAPTAEENVGVDAPSAAPPTSQGAQLQTPADVPTQPPATSETYVATIRPDGSLAPDTTPRATVAPPPAATPDAIGAMLTGGEKPAPSAPVETNAPGENPPAAKPTKKRTVTHAAKVASPNPAAATGEPPAAVANPTDSGHPAAAAKPIVPKPVALKPVAPKPRPASVAAKKIDGAPQRAPDAENGGGIFESATQAVGSLTGAVKKLVGAD
jgi:hypothetical protein